MLSAMTAPRADEPPAAPAAAGSHLTWALVGPGARAIPPPGWGGVENLIRDYRDRLQALGHRAVVVNTADERECADAIGRCRPDVVHVHHQRLAPAVAGTGAPVKIFTSHDPHFPLRYVNPYHRYGLFKMLKADFFFCCLSAVQAKKYVAYGCDASRVFTTATGVAFERFRFSDAPARPGRSIYLANVTRNKRQDWYQTIDAVDFVGPIKNDGHAFDRTRGNYLGEWLRDHLYTHLTDYANLVLLSEGEVAPLVVREALVCGLGVVVSPACTVNLDLSLPWITVIPDGRLDDLDYVEAAIARNREVSLRRRRDIRAYGVEHFSYETLVARYADRCAALRRRAGGRRAAFRPRIVRLYFRRQLPAQTGEAIRAAFARPWRFLSRTPFGPVLRRLRRRLDAGGWSSVLIGALGLGLWEPHRANPAGRDGA